MGGRLWIKSRQPPGPTGAGHPGCPRFLFGPIASLPSGAETTLRLMCFPGSVARTPFTTHAGRLRTPIVGFGADSEQGNRHRWSTRQRAASTQLRTSLCAGGSIGSSNTRGPGREPRTRLGERASARCSGCQPAVPALTTFASGLPLAPLAQVERALHCQCSGYGFESHTGLRLGA